MNASRGLVVYWNHTKPLARGEDVVEFDRLLLAIQQGQALDVFFGLFCLALIIDLARNGLDGRTNSPWIAFLDSVSHCSSWLALGDLPMGPKILGALLSKSVSGLITSSLFGFPAPFSQTFSVVSFAVAVGLCCYVPELPPLVRSAAGPWRLLFVSMSALHKSRKLRAVLQGRPRVIVLGLLTIELTGWVTVVLRGYFAHQNLVEAVSAWLAFVVLNRLRLGISLSAIAAVRCNSLLVLPLLALHKTAVPSKDGTWLQLYT